MKIVNDMNDDDIKVVNDMKDLSLKVLWFEKILIRLKRLRLSRTKKLMIESESEINEKEKWLDLKFKSLLLSCVLNSTFDNLMIALSNRKLNNSKFNNAIVIWCFVNINLANAGMIMMLLWLLYTVAYPLWHVFINKLTFHISEIDIV